MPPTARRFAVSTGPRSLSVADVTGLSARARATAHAYDAVADQYADLVRDELEGLPLDRAILTAFADLVRDGEPGPVAELGCGPGRITHHLHRMGVEIFGIDLSPALIGIARASFPGLRFDVGSMDALDLPGDCLAGVVSWYSIIHIPPDDMPAYLTEFRRVLRAGAPLLLGFFEAAGEPVTAFDHKVITAYRWPIDTLARTAGEAGFTEIGRMLREPGDGERFRRGHLLMRAADRT
ncbi:MAG: class I SAM-dependent methyltransferase [Nocardia sp.]|nr:class I SAM-dependent methyltransferase [Nocardia sp.]